MMHGFMCRAACLGHLATLAWIYWQAVVELLGWGDVSRRILLGLRRAGDKLVELVEWLRAGAIEREALLLDALAQAPLPRKAGAPSHNQNIAAPAGAYHTSSMSAALVCEVLTDVSFTFEQQVDQVRADCVGQHACGLSHRGVQHACGSGEGELQR